MLKIWWYWLKQSTSKCDSKGDSIWLIRQEACASSTGIVWSWMILLGKEILKIRITKYMAEIKRLEKSSSDVYKWYTSYRCDLLVNYVFLGYFGYRIG